MAQGGADANWNNPNKYRAIDAIGYVAGQEKLPANKIALFDISSCYDRLGKNGKYIWNNGNPREGELKPISTSKVEPTY